MDLTGYRHNIAFEMGIARVLGKKTLLVGQRGVERSLFPMIAKLRVWPYSTERIDAELGSAIGRWLRSSP